MSLSLSPKAKASWELRKATKKSPWHNNHLPYIVKERTYLLGSTPCVRVGHGASIFFPRWCPSGASNFRPDMAAQCAKLHKIVSLIRISIKDSRNCNYFRTQEEHFACIGHGARTFCDAIFRVPKGAFTNYVCIFWHFLTTYVPSLHFLCSKLHVFLTTYPPVTANIIC